MNLPTIKSLNLTPAGQVRLTCFSPEALTYADAHRPITFRAFVRYARSWMESQGEYIDYIPIAELAFRMGVRGNDPVVYPKTTEPKNSALQNDLLNILRGKGKI